MSVSARSAAAEERSVNSSTMGESQLWAAAAQVGGSGLEGGSAAAIPSWGNALRRCGKLRLKEVGWAGGGPGARWRRARGEGRKRR